MNEQTNVAIGNPEINPVPSGNFLQTDENMTKIARALEGLILSASGWRKVFAVEGNEESDTPDISSADAILTAGMAGAFADFLRMESHTERPIIALGIDARPTGPVMAHIMLRVFLSLGLQVRYLFITPAPEIMAYVRNVSELDGFAYISASHNPVGHNGVKFGLTSGGVLNGIQAARLIDLYRALVTDSDALAGICRKGGDISATQIAQVFRAVRVYKKEAGETYFRFTKKVVSALNSDEDQARLFQKIRDACEVRPFGIIGELNGSARGVSIDREVFEAAGLRVTLLNDKPGQIVHRIVPEGDSLHLCREELEKAAREDPAYQLGYVPDNDGDRGNLVYYDAETGRSEIIEAQEVFALAVLAELSYLSWAGLEKVDDRGRFTGKVAVAVNGPTSMRIDVIAERFGAEVFRAEVGEANVVGLADRLRERGYTVRILGEGSNGGNITHPSAVRDPLSTVFALVKMLRLEPGETDTQTGMNSILRSLPKYITTSAFEPGAIMRIRTTDHGELKLKYEGIFLRQWETRKAALQEKYGICAWEEINYEGTEEKRGFGAEYRTGRQKGGLKILFHDSSGDGIAYMWMRGSGTEPVFRVLVDVAGDRPEMERDLLAWHRKMIEEADTIGSGEAKRTVPG